MTQRRLPLTVIGGFLGAGKTTLLNRMLAQAQGRRLAVLVNDFGALNIDAALVASQDGTTMALTNGCVCCQIGDDLTAALVTVLDQAERFDAVVVEASGVSDPWRIAQVGLAEPQLALDSVLVMLDASTALDQAADPLLADTVRRQLRAADLVVVNKTDLVPDTEMTRLRAWLDEVIGSAPRHETCHADVPAALLGDLHGEVQRVACTSCPGGADHAHHHDHDHGHALDPDHGGQFETWLHRPAAPLNATALRALLRAMPAGVLRLKGLVATHEHALAEMQFAGRHGSLRHAAAATAAAPAGWGVVAIGLKGRLPRAALEQAFTAAAR